MYFWLVIVLDVVFYFMFVGKFVLLCLCSLEWVIVLMMFDGVLLSVDYRLFSFLEVLKVLRFSGLIRL